MYTTLFFDLDETLLDTLANGKDTLEDIYELYDIQRFFASFDNFSDTYFRHNFNLWELYNHGKIDKPSLMRQRFTEPFRDIPEVNEEMMNAMNDDFLSRVVLKNKTIEGAKEILEYLSPKYTMHIISNGFSELQETKLIHAGLRDYFDQLILSDEVGFNKPHPGIFEHALELTGCSKDEVIMIGDNISTDIAGAIGVGIDQIWFNPDKRQAGDLKPTYMVHSLNEIGNIL